MTKPERSSQLHRALAGLRQKILGGEFAPGERLKETAVSRSIGISRTPLRQAVDVLVSEGMLERLPTGGSRVASFRFQDIVDAIEIRGVLEGTAARLAAERGADDLHLQQARTILTRLDTALDRPGEMDFESYVQNTAAFHDLIARMAGSPRGPRDRFAPREVRT